MNGGEHSYRDGGIGMVDQGGSPTGYEDPPPESPVPSPPAHVAQTLARHITFLPDCTEDHASCVCCAHVMLHMLSPVNSTF